MSLPKSNLLEFVASVTGRTLQPYQRELCARIDEAHARGETLRFRPPFRERGKSTLDEAWRQYRAALARFSAS